MPTVVTFGEIMLRLSTPGFSRFRQATAFDASFGGGEANVATSLAVFGHEARFVTKLPEHEVGQAAVDQLRRYGVDTRFVVRGGDRVGVYFLETGASQRPSKVIYDRARSAVAEMEHGEVDWGAAMGGADWFHWTGDHARARGEAPAGRRGRVPCGEGGGRDRLVRPQLPLEAVDDGRGPGRDAPAHGARRRVRGERGGR